MKMSNEVQAVKTPTPTALITPEAQAFVSASISAAVKEAVSGVFASLGPILEKLALTPEKIRAANTPFVDPAKVARDKRETEKSKQDERELRAAEAARKAACPHLDQNSRPSVRLIHNFPDRQPRGICVVCQDLITPKMWVIDAPDAENPKGRAYLQEAHKDYRIVALLEAQSG
jgi:hypothetical protein